MKLIRLIAVLCLALLPLMPLATVEASNITDATFTGVITITNNDTAATNAVIPMSANATAWITAGYLNASANNSAIQYLGADVAYMPDPTSNQWWLFVQSIAGTPGVGILSENLFTGGATAMSGNMSYFPSPTGNITVPYSAALEATAQPYDYIIAGYLDMSKVGSHLLYHGINQLRVYIASTTTIRVYSASTTLDYTATGLTSGYQTISIYDDGVNAALYSNGVLKGTQAHVAIPSMAQPWVWADAGAFIYVSYVSVRINGALQQYTAPTYATTFPDLTGNGHTATPSFITTATHPNVTATLSTFLPVTEAKAPAYSANATTDFISTNATATGNFTTTIAPTYPGAAIVTAIAAAGGVPAQLPSTIISAIIVLACSLSASSLLRGQTANGTIFIKIGIITAVMLLGTVLKVLDLWMVVFFLFMAIAAGQASRSR